jgi:hypothetical protein
MKFFFDINIKKWIIIILLVITGLTGAQNQAPVSSYTMTRPRIWTRIRPNGSLDRESNYGTNSFELSYPGYFNSNTEASGGWDKNAIYIAGQIAGEDVAWMMRNGNYTDADFYTLTSDAPPAQPYKNYNLLNPGYPEEYIQGTIYSPKLDGLGKRHLSLKLDGLVMGWSVPKYDDFILIKCRLTNTDSDTIKNFYYTRWITPNGPYSPSSVSPGWDKEYLWSNDSLGFIFYDDDTKSPVSNPPHYSIFPGTITGNAGDPGNIGVQGSRDFKLYSPTLYAYTFIPISNNSLGNKKVWRKIVSSSSTAPSDEIMPGWNTEMKNYQTLVDFITKDEQPKLSWRAADSMNTINPGSAPGAGSKWERNPRYIYAIGPYNIAPGQIVEWYEVLLCGQMDRNITMKGITGDSLVTTKFVQQGLENLMANWNSAQSLIKNSLRIAKDECPPPTPCDAPRVGNTNELQVVAQSFTDATGKRIPGVNLTWYDVHKSAAGIIYKDPLNGKQDFAAYKVYRSDNSIEGPWVQIDSIPVAKADSLVIGGQITWFEKAEPNIPYRYCVTSIDTARNESAMTGYSYYPVAADPNPSNNLNTVLVVPNPFRQVSGFNDQSENKRLAFLNIPSKCTIRIYTLALDLIRTLEHTQDSGLQTWGSAQTKDYMLTDFAQNVMPGIYIYHIESHVPGHEGETSVGKFAIIK